MRSCPTTKRWKRRRSKELLIKRKLFLSSIVRTNSIKSSSSSSSSRSPFHGPNKRTSFALFWHISRLISHSDCSVSSRLSASEALEPLSGKLWKSPFHLHNYWTIVQHSMEFAINCNSNHVSVAIAKSAHVLLYDDDCPKSQSPFLATRSRIRAFDLGVVLLLLLLSVVRRPTTFHKSTKGHTDRECICLADRSSFFLE